MPVSYRILPARGLVFVRFEGRITVDEAGAAFAAFTRDPDRGPVHKHLLDFSGVTGWTADFPGLMRLHAGQLDVLRDAHQEILYVYHAPEGPARPLARVLLPSWEEVPGVVALLQDTEAGALDLLGQPETSFAVLLQDV